mmetsp:Transcript_5726/g.12090  ORF Transcript_5726/g.12090 Transcript_5726/m.12090 type:complete len:455 (-) Transcript_5726:1279-2643(-)
MKPSPELTAVKSNKSKNSKGNGGPSSRKRPRRNTVVTLQEEAQDYYNRLQYKCQKEWNKQIKATKKLESLKLMKRVQQERKQTTSSNDNDNQETLPTTTKLQRLEEELQDFKAVDAQLMVDEALRRLGVKNLDPSLSLALQHEEDEEAKDDSDSKSQNDSEQDSGDDVSASKNAEEDQTDLNVEDSKSKQMEKPTDPKPTLHSPPIVATKEQSQWIERVLSQSRLVKLMEEWNQEISNYRKWYLQRQQYFEEQNQEGGEDNHKKRNKKDKKIKNGKTNPNTGSSAEERDYLTYGQSVFVQLGNDGNAQMMGGDNSDVENDDDDDFEGVFIPTAANTKPKKNRPGQRARKAKAMAKEQQEHNGYQRSPRRGPSNPEESLNWRGRNRGGGAQKGSDDKSRRRSNESNSQGAPPPAKRGGNGDDIEGPLHPSWEARKAKSDGIVQFQGKKITFDNDD